MYTLPQVNQDSQLSLRTRKERASFVINSKAVIYSTANTRAYNLQQRNHYRNHNIVRDQQVNKVICRMPMFSNSPKVFMFMSTL